MNAETSNAAGQAPMAGLCFGVVILAAGSSRRMDRPKLLLPWTETTVLGDLVRRWGQLDAGQIGVVCAVGARELQDELNRLGFPAGNRIFNPAPERGMFSSIQCAAAWPGWKAELKQWVVTLGDQPHLSVKTLRTLLEFGAAHPDRICQPMRGGRGKHPVLLPKAAFLALRDSSASDLKEFLEAHDNERAGFESDDAGLDFDMDTPADYERARKFASDCGGLS